MRTFFITVFFCLLVPGQAQVPDSLLQVAMGLRHDSDRVLLFYSEGFSHRSIDPYYSYACARQAIKFSENTSLGLYRAKALNLLGILYYRNGELVKARDLHLEALKLRQTLGDRRGEALSYTNLGNVSGELAQSELATTYYMKALTINLELGENKQADNCLLNLAVLSVETGKLNEAEESFKLCLSRARSRYDYELEAMCLNNLAVIYIQQQEPDLAIAAAENSIKVKELMDNEMEKADSYLNLASAHLQKKEPDKAAAQLEAATKIIRKFNYFEAELESKPVFAEYYSMIGNFQGAFLALKDYNRIRDSLKRLPPDPLLLFEEDERVMETESQKQFPYLYLALLLCIVLFSVFLATRTLR